MIRLQDARKLSPKTKEAIRIRAVKMYEEGHIQNEVAQQLGVSRQMVSTWYQKYKRNGLDALKAKAVGRPKDTGLLQPQEEEKIRHLIISHTPDELGLSHDLWTRPAVLELVENELDVTVDLTTIGKWLQKWGLTPQKPARRAREQNPEAVKT